MNTDYWLESWKQNKIGFHQHEINDHLSSFGKQLNIGHQQGHYVLDIEINMIAIRDFLSKIT
jgi:hypothetical protein